MDAKTIKAAATAAALAMTAPGCAEAPLPAEPAMLMPSLAAYAQADPAEAFGAAGLTFAASRRDGDAAIFEGVRYEGGDGTVLTADSLRVVGMATGAGGQMRADRVRASGIVLRLPAAEVAAEEAEDEDAEAAGRVTVRTDPAVIRIASLDLEEPSFRSDADAAPDPDDAGARMRRAADAMDRVAFARMRAEDLSLETGGVTAATERVLLDGYARGLLGAVRLSGIDAGLPGGQDDLRAAFGGLPQAAAFLDTPLGRMATASADRFVVGEVRWGGLDLRGVREDLARGVAPGMDTADVVFGDVLIEDQETYVDGALAQRVAATRIEGVRFDGVVPTAGTARTEGAVTDLTAYVAGDEAAAALLAGRGLDAVRGEGASSFAYAPDEGTLSMRSVSDVDGFYGARVSLAVSGLGPREGLFAEGEAGAEAMEAMLARASLSDLTVVLDDGQLLDTGFALAALGTEQSATELRQQAVGLVTLGALQGGAISPRVPRYANAISSFLSDGGTLTIRAAPEGGLSAEGARAAMAQGPGGVLEAANLTIERTE